MNRRFRLVLGFAALLSLPVTAAAGLRAGLARIDITDRAAGPVHDPSYAKALVLQDGDTRLALVTVDAVAVGEIGRIGNGFLAAVRARLQQELGLPPEAVIVNASHCHGVVRGDTAELVVQAVREAAAGLVPVRAAAGVGHEDGISENRRLTLKDGTEADMRRAYALPRDAAVAAVGPIDPKIGLLRLDREDGRPLAVLYHFACHPIMNPPSKGSSADYPGVASRVIEENLGAMAFFVQGCGGDLNPVRYKEVHLPQDAEPLGHRLGLSVLRGLKPLQSQAAGLKVRREVIALPRAADFEARIAAIEAEQKRLLAALRGTTLEFKAFLPLLLQQKLAPEFPSHHAQSYLHERARGRSDLERQDADNRAAVEAYLHNLGVLEQLTRLNANLALLKKHQAQTLAAGRATLDAEVCAVRIGDFKWVTFPGEVTVQVGLDIQKAAADPTAFVSGYTNGYIYYTATAAQRRNRGYAQEDCDVLVAPEWQQQFERKALELLRGL